MGIFALSAAHTHLALGSVLGQTKIEDVTDAESALDAIPLARPILILVAVGFFVYMFLQSLKDFAKVNWAKGIQKLLVPIVVLMFALFPGLLFGLVDVFQGIFESITDVFS